MKIENKKLGKGLGALLSGGQDREDKTFKIINISQIHANKDQPRKNFNKNELEELAASIRSQGILQPIVVRTKENDSYEIVAGERRWRAAQIAGAHEIPALIKEMSDEAAKAAALIENIQRENLNPIEEANAYEILLNNQNINPDKLSEIVGKSKSHISNMIRLLELDTEILEHVIFGRLSMGHARALIGVPNAKQMAEDIINKKLSVRETEKNTKTFKKKKNRQKTKDPNIIDLENELSEKIGLKTSIHFNDQGSSGSLTLYYSSLDQLDDIMKRLKK